MVIINIFRIDMSMMMMIVDFSKSIEHENIGMKMGNKEG